MKITCPTCNTVYNIPSHKIPKGKKVSTKCKKCDGRIVVEARIDKTKPTIPKKEPAFIKETKSQEKTIDALSKQKIVEKESKRTITEAREKKKGLKGNNLMQLEKAKKNIKNGWIAASISATVTLIVSLISLTGSSIAGFNLLNLLDVALIAGLGFGIYKESRACAVIMFTYFLISKILIWTESGKPSGIVLAVIFLYLYFQAIRGTFAIKNIQQTGEASQPAH